MVFEPGQRRAHHADRGIARRHRRMTGRRMRRQNQRGIAFFGDADQCGWLAEAFDEAFRDQQAFIEHEVEPHTARSQGGGDGLCAPDAGDFLVMAEREIDGPPGTKSIASHRFGGLQHRIEVALVVPRSAAPDKTVGDDAIEWRLLRVLSPEEVLLLLEAAPGPKHKAALSVAYGA